MKLFEWSGICFHCHSSRTSNSQEKSVGWILFFVYKHLHEMLVGTLKDILRNACRDAAEEKGNPEGISYWLSKEIFERTPVRKSYKITSVEYSSKSLTVEEGIF